MIVFPIMNERLYYCCMLFVFINTINLYFPIYYNSILTLELTPNKFYIINAFLLLNFLPKMNLTFVSNEEQMKNTLTI